MTRCESRHGHAGLLLPLSSLIALTVLLVTSGCMRSNDRQPPSTSTGSADQSRLASGVVLPLDYREECGPCGAAFAVDSLQVGNGGNFRVHLTIRSTGAHPLRFAGGAAYTFEPSRVEDFLTFIEVIRLDALVGSFTVGWSDWFPASGESPNDPWPALRFPGCFAFGPARPASADAGNAAGR